MSMDHKCSMFSITTDNELNFFFSLKKQMPNAFTLQQAKIQWGPMLFENVLQNTTEHRFGINYTFHFEVKYANATKFQDILSLKNNFIPLSCT